MIRTILLISFLSGCAANSLPEGGPGQPIAVYMDVTRPVMRSVIRPGDALHWQAAGEFYRPFGPPRSRFATHQSGQFVNQPISFAMKTTRARVVVTQPFSGWTFFWAPFELMLATPSTVVSNEHMVRDQTSILGVSAVVPIYGWRDDSGDLHHEGLRGAIRAGIVVCTLTPGSLEPAPPEDEVLPMDACLGYSPAFAWKVKTGDRANTLESNR